MLLILFNVQRRVSKNVWRQAVVGSIEEQPTWQKVEERVSRGPTSRLTPITGTKPWSTTLITAETSIQTANHTTHGALQWTQWNNGSSVIFLLVVICSNITWNSKKQSTKTFGFVLNLIKKLFRNINTLFYLFTDCKNVVTQRINKMNVN